MPQLPIQQGDPSGAVDPYRRSRFEFGAGGSMDMGPDDPYAGNMMGAYGDQLKYARGLQGRPSAAAAQVQRDARMGGEQGSQIIGAQAGAMGANPAMQRSASYGGTQMQGQMQGQARMDAGVLQAQQNTANQQLMQQTLQQRAMYEQMMQDDATRRYGGILGLQSQQYGADTNAYLSGLEGDAAERDMYIKLGGAITGAAGAGGAAAGGAYSDRRLKARRSF